MTKKEVLTSAVSDASVSGVSGLAVAGEVVGLLEEQAVGVLVAQGLFALAHAAPGEIEKKRYINN